MESVFPVGMVSWALINLGENRREQWEIVSYRGHCFKVV